MPPSPGGENWPLGAGRLSVAGITHYELLGVASTASTEEIRRAYRRLARVHHPDHDADDAGTMAAVNEAYRVLRHPGRRAAYDAGLATVAQRRATSPRPSSPPAKARLVRVEDRSVARYPWKLVVGAAVVGAAVVLGAAALTDPPPPERPDNLLEPGSCVAIEANDDAREVTCAGSAEDLVVERLVPLDGACPVGLSAYRDRQGMGYACVERRGPATTGGRAASLRCPCRARSSVG